MPFRVDVMEYERGWGARVDEIVYFNELTEAEAYADVINSHNTALRAPDWYIQAETPFFVRDIPAGQEARDE